MSLAFKQRLFPPLPAIAEHFGTPFHIYDEIGIRESCERVLHTFGSFPGFREYYAVKALPNPHILRILRLFGFGFDCSSIPELEISRQIGASGDDIMFTSNNTSTDEFETALSSGGCILNLDDVSFIEKLPSLPHRLSFRYNPGERRVMGNAIIGNPVESKYGISHQQFLPAYQQARDIGITRFGLHTMLVSNERDFRQFVQTARMLLELAAWADEALQIRFEFLNIGGGLGIPYRPDDTPLDIERMAVEISRLWSAFEAEHGYVPALHMESGRYVTGPHGVLVTRVINRKHTYREYIGVDAAMSALMRPGMYGAYHHIDVLGQTAEQEEITADVVGSLCENNDKFAVQRRLPKPDIGDLLVIHDTGAHGHAMGFNYNGRLRPQELLLHRNGTVTRVRRAETLSDYLATLKCDADGFAPETHDGLTTESTGY
jgi:diaminopimelate decarboxylase